MEIVIVLGLVAAAGAVIDDPYSLHGIPRLGNSAEEAGSGSGDVNIESVFASVPTEAMPADATLSTNDTVPRYGNITDGVLTFHRERCLRERSFLDCLEFKGYKFLKDLFESAVSTNVSDVVDTPRNVNEPLLVRLPPARDRKQSVVLKAVRRAFGASALTEMFEFVVEQLDNFLSGHGVIITVKSVEPEPDSPWMIASVDEDDARVGRSTRKAKRKEIAIVFPMMVLFKFLKIKMLLVPILLGVVFLKKLLILTLTLLPYLIGLFGCCRRPPFIGGVQSSGIIHELDTRGDVSTNFAYSFPSRDDFGFRHKDKNRPTEFYEY